MVGCEPGAGQSSMTMPSTAPPGSRAAVGEDNIGGGGGQLRGGGGRGTPASGAE